MLGESIRRRRGQDRRPKSSGQGPQRSLPWKRWLLATLLILPLAFGTGYAVAALILFPVTAEAADELVAVPQLVGRERAAAEQELQALGLTISEATELPHPFEPAGRVTAQSPLPGQRLYPGAAVQLAVSTGRPQLSVPDLIGLPYRDAATLAENLGFTVNRREETGAGAVDVVLRIEPAPGTTRELPATIVLVVTAPPVPESLEFQQNPGFPENSADPDIPDTPEVPVLGG